MRIKQFCAVALALLLAVGILNGCSKEKVTAESLLQDAADHTKEKSSVSMQLTMDFDMSMEDPESGATYDAATTIEADMGVVKEPLSMQADAVISSAFDGEMSEEKATIYAIPAEEEGKVLLYTRAQMEEEGDFWYKETVEKNTYETVEHNAKLPEIFVENEDISFTLREETEKYEEQDVYVLEGKVTGTTLKNLAGALDTVGDVLGVSGNDAILTSEANVEYRIYKKDHMPASVVIDMTEMVKTMMVDYGIAIEKSELNIVFKEFDAIEEIKVPQEGLDNAFDIADMGGDLSDEDMEIEWEEGEDEEAVEQEDVIIDTTDTTETLKVSSIEDPGAMNEWVGCYALASDGQYYQIGVRITDIKRGADAQDVVQAYFEDREEPAFEEEPKEPLEFAAISYEVYIPKDFPDEEFAGIEMYVIDQDGNYLSSEEYEFTDMFWIEPAVTEELYAAPGAYGKGVGLCTMEKDREAFCVEIGDSWYHEGYILVE